jgi:succinate-semialdehyde dehydrogenase/glutarate-semialdehyde dehydrogenase
MQHGMAETPWGGYKESSVGRTHGRIGLEAMTSPKVVVESRFRRAVSQIWWLPNGPRAYAVVSSILPVLYGPNRLRAVARVVPAFLRSLFGPPK